MYSCSHFPNPKKNKKITNNQSFTAPIKIVSNEVECGLTQHFFDPSKSSPPNDFMIKLQMRMSRFSNKNHTFINEDSRDSE
jgi:hypothetical protein